MDTIEKKHVECLLKRKKKVEVRKKKKKHFADLQTLFQNNYFVLAFDSNVHAYRTNKAKDQGHIVRQL